MGNPGLPGRQHWAIANFRIAEMLYEMRVPWALAGALGAGGGAVRNWVSSIFTWRQRALGR